MLADFKPPDVRDLETTQAFEAGAGMKTVIGGTALSAWERRRDAALPLEM